MVRAHSLMGVGEIGNWTSIAGVWDGDGGGGEVMIVLFMLVENHDC